MIKMSHKILSVLLILLLLAALPACGSTPPVVDQSVDEEALDPELLALAPDEVPVLVDTPDADNAADMVEILLVTPSTNVIATEQVTLQVEVAYSLQSTSSGNLQIGFNDGDDPGRYNLQGTAQPVSAGEDTSTLSATVTAKHWDAPDVFSVYVALLAEEDDAVLAADWVSIENMTVR